MVGSSSHIWCEACHAVRIHATDRFRLCRRCATKHKRRLAEERRKAKNRKALRSKVNIDEAVKDYLTDRRIDAAVDDMLTGNNITRDLDAKAVLARVMLEHPDPAEVLITPAVYHEKGTPTPMPEPEPALMPSTLQVRKSYQRISRDMPADLKLEIGAHYENLQVPGADLTREYGISGGTLMAIVDELGLQRRSARDDHKAMRHRKPGYFTLQDGKHIWLSGRRPTASQKAYEQGKRDAQWPAANLRGAMGAQHRVVEPEPEPSPAATPQTAALWHVQVTGSLLIAADDIGQAFYQVQHEYPHLRITGITESRQ